MDILVEKSSLNGKIKCIASKSYVHRLLIASALSDKPTTIIGRIQGDDIDATIGCLQKAGAKIIKNGDSVVVEPLSTGINSGISINACESGSTLRFLLPVLSALGINARLDGKGRLSERPIIELQKALKDNGANFSADKLPFEISGKLRSGKYYINGSISSQYISGLLLSLPLLNGDSEIIIEGQPVSKGYIDVTIDVLSKFGIVVSNTSDGYYIKGNQKYISPSRAFAEGDWSNSAFFLVGGALCGQVEVEGLDIKSKQADKSIFDILKKAKVDISNKDYSIKTKRSSIDVLNDADLSKYPDLAQILAVLCLSNAEKSTFIGAKRLTLKESNRLEAIIDMVENVGGIAKFDDEILSICGKIVKKRIVIDTFNDHRQAMAGAIIGCVYGNTIIKNADVVNKSYPEFWDDLKRLGGKINVI